MKLDLLTSFNDEFFLFIIEYLFRFSPWLFLDNPACYDICHNFEVARQCILDYYGGLKVDIEAAHMLRLLLFYYRELVTMIEVRLYRRNYYINKYAIQLRFSIFFQL